MADYEDDKVNRAKNNFYFQKLYSICKNLNRENDMLENFVITSKNHVTSLENENEKFIKKNYHLRNKTLNAKCFEIKPSL